MISVVVFGCIYCKTVHPHPTPTFIPHLSNILLFDLLTKITLIQNFKMGHLFT